MTTLTQTQRPLRVSQLGTPNPLPRIAWQRFTMPPPHPHPSLSAVERAGAFVWGTHSILPYDVLDGYERSQREGTLSAICLENDFLRATLYPTLGGRLASLYDKRARRELLFDNPVFQPANLAVLNAWFSGGIEWNGIIPGHSPFTCAPVFMARVETERGPLVRLYEFERIREAIWQIDLFLPHNAAHLWIHGRLFNPNAHAIKAYGWTNIAVPLSAGMRVLSPADYCIEHVAPDHHLAALPFPHAHGYDGSYPHQYDYAASVFFRKRELRRPWLTALDREGVGVLHVSTHALANRKLFVFGNHAGGRRWMDFLSLPQQGAYIEIQAGILPTQDQEFDIAGQQAYEWTECLMPFAAAVAVAHQTDFQAACRAIEVMVDETVSETQLQAMDTWLQAHVEQPVTELLSHGRAWGMLHERMTGQRLSSGLAFEARVTNEALWAELLAHGTFSAETLRHAPAAWAVSPRWVNVLEASRATYGTTWLHELLLGVAHLNEGQWDAAREHLQTSLQHQENFLAHRHLAWLAHHHDQDIAQAAAHYAHAWTLSSQLTALAVERCQFYQQTNMTDALEAFLAQLPTDAQQHERIRLARGEVALKLRDVETLREILAGEFSTIREGERLLTELWYGLQRIAAERELQRALTPEEEATVFKANPIPQRINFQMRTTITTTTK